MKLLIRQKIVLCISPQQMMAGVWHGKKLLLHRQFNHDAIGAQAFAVFLQQHAHAVFYLICNVSEEDYQRQLLPHSTGLTQKALLARKLSQTYRGLLFSAAIQQGRERSASKKDIVLFAAIRHEQCLQPWLEMLQKSDSAIAGVYLLPMLSEQLLQSGIVAAQPTQHLLLCERLSSGLRHSYFQHGHLSMSRLLTHASGPQAAWSDVHLAETDKSRLYLISQRLLDADTPLHVTLLDHSHLEKLAKQLRLPLPALIQTPELAHMQRLVHGAGLSKRINLAPRALTQKYREQRTSLKLSAVTFLVLLLCTAISIYCLQEGKRLATETRFLRTQLAHAQRGFAKLRQHSHPLTAKAAHIKNVVAAAQQLETQQLEAVPMSPLRMMQVLSTGFAKMGDAASSIKLESLDWSLNIAETAAEPANESAFIRLAASDESTLQHYTAHLRQHPQVATVAIISTSPAVLQSTIQGSTAADENAAETMPRFQISVSLKPKHEREPR